MKSIPTIILIGIAIVFGLSAIGFALNFWAPWILDFTGYLIDVLLVIALVYFWGFGGFSAIKDAIEKYKAKK